MFFSLLFAAGSETTRNAIAGGLARPGRASRPAADAARRSRRSCRRAIEEILRWTTPSPSKRRTATVTTELAGHTIAPGDKVVVWEGSANRDERAFERLDERSTSPATRTCTSGSATGSTSASAPASRGSRCGVMYDELLQRFRTIEAAGADRVDPQQPPHRDPPPARSPSPADSRDGARCARVRNLLQVVRSHVVALDVADEAFGERVGVEAELGEVVARARRTGPCGCASTYSGDRGRAPRRRARHRTRRRSPHRADRIGHEVGVLHVDDRVLRVGVAERVDATDRRPRASPSSARRCRRGGRRR